MDLLLKRLIIINRFLLIINLNFFRLTKGRFQGINKLVKEVNKAKVCLEVRGLSTKNNNKKKEYL